MQPELAEISSAFQFRGSFTEAVPYGTGHINDTYHVLYTEGTLHHAYLLQRINHQVFKDVPRLMENISRVTLHLQNNLEPLPSSEQERRALRIIPTRYGQHVYNDPQGRFWRAYAFIGGARTLEVIETPNQAYEAAKAFGTFMRQLSDLPPPRLNETLPDFHNTRVRFERLRHAIEADSHNRNSESQPEIQFAMNREFMVDTLLDLQTSGDLPERITHNDTKLNNVLIDNLTAEGICVVDLDTVMPGLSLYDFGDMVRTATNTGKEDDPVLERVGCDLQLFESLVQGYLESAGDVLTPGEIEHLPFSGKLMTYEVGIRFLTDYLSGDHYFKTHRPNHNLERARAQFKLVESIEAQESLMKQIVQRHAP